MYLCCINTYTCLEAQHAWHTVIYWVFFPNFYADVFCELEVIKVYSKMLLFENINQNLMFVSASIRFLKTDHYFDTDFCIINMIHLRSLHHSPFYLYFFSSKFQTFTLPAVWIQPACSQVQVALSVLRGSKLKCAPVLKTKQLYLPWMKSKYLQTHTNLPCVSDSTDVAAGFASLLIHPVLCFLL